MEAMKCYRNKESYQDVYKRQFFARFKEAAFGKVAASVIADTEVTVFSSDNPDGGV